MSPRPCLPLLLAASFSLLAVSAPAQTLESCGLQARLPQLTLSDKEPVVINFLGEVDYCSTVRVAAVGEAAVLGLGQPAGTLNVILAQRPTGEGGCPAIVVPFKTEARLPERLPATALPGLLSVGVYLRFEDPDGNLVEQLTCGTIGLSVGEGYRSEVPLHGGRFRASVTWNVSGQDGNGFAVPGDGTASDSALFWFFQPGNWELMAKVLDGCGVNDHYWVIGAASTDVRYTLRITDTLTGGAWSQTNPGGQLAPAFADVQAFPCNGPS